MNIKKLSFFISFLTTALLSKAQSVTDNQQDTIIIEQIIVLGNKKTKLSIINRELDIKKGDTLLVADTSAIFERNRNKIINTGLFNFVTISHVSKTLIILVEERWYIWPIPIFELADRSFNEWWVDRNRDFRRVNIGMDFEHRNFRGRNEKLRIKLQQGFLKKYELSYKVPYINSFLSNGMKFTLSYSTNNKTAYATEDNKLAFINSETTTRERFYTGIELNRRPKYYLTYVGQVNYRHNTIADTITKLNPHYFGFNKTKHQFFEINLSLKYDKRDIQYYPYKGKVIELTLKKKGLGIFKDLDLTRLQLETAFYKNHKKRIIWENIFKAQFNLPNNLPYFNYFGLGYGEDLVRGYELDVVDGNHYFLIKESLKFRLFHRDKLNTFIPIKQFSATPFSVFVHPHLDAGYVINNNSYFNNKLADQLLVGYGVGVDFVAFYDSVLRVEYSWKKDGQGGLFLHSGIPF